MSNRKHTHNQFERNVFPVIYITGLLLAFHHAFIIYINSSFLSQFVDQKLVGLLYVAGALLTILSLTRAPKMLQRFGNFKMVIYLVSLEILCLLSLAIFKNVFFILPIFILHHAINPIILFCLDVLLEDYSKNNETGSVRGIFLTVLSIPSIIATFTLSIILANNEFSKIYFISSFFLIPLLLIFYHSFKNFRDPVYKEPDVKHALQVAAKNKDIYNIFTDNFLLQLFYAFIVIYMPLYLHTVVGFSFSQIGLMYSISLLPFIVLEIPVGRIADKLSGEKEPLILGFVIMSLSIVIISLLQTNNFVVWTFLLLLTRVGASLIEITTESYFFKHVNKTDSNLMSIFRMISPAAHIFTAITASILLWKVPYNYVFFIFGIMILIVGLRHTIPLSESKK